MPITLNGDTGITVPSGATQAEAEAGTSNTVLMTPLRTFQALKSMTINVQEFITAGGPFTWTKPVDAIYCEVLVVGGGGAGAVGTPFVMCGTARQSGTGGNAGGTSKLIVNAATLGATETVTIGAGGATTGATGGTSSFGSHASATGGGATGGTGSGTNTQTITGERGGGGGGNALNSAWNISETIGGSTEAGPGGIASTAGSRGSGGGGGDGAASFGAGGAGYVRVITYCA